MRLSDLDKDQPYRSASYPAEPHPDDPEHQELWVELPYCTRCGAVVHNNTLHNAWQDRINR